MARIRQADEDVVMSQEMYAEMLIARGGEKYKWESRTSEYTIDDVDISAVKTYLNKAKDVGRGEDDEDSLITPPSATAV